MSWLVNHTWTGFSVHLVRTKNMGRGERELWVVLFLSGGRLVPGIEQVFLRES